MQLRDVARASLLFVPILLTGCPSPPAVTDAGSDAATNDGGPADGGVDAFRACTTTADCDDGLFCNGAETCDSGVCVADAVDCDDGLECTVDACSEATRACVHEVPDDDGDGSADASCLDASGVPLGDDCADDDAQRFPGNREVCDVLAHDEDCDPDTLGGLDNDGDGFVSDECCNGATCGDDCDDARSGTHPGVAEVCDGFDQDCNDEIDDGVALDGFEDRDRDGWGDSALPLAACASTVGWSAMGGDCNDDPTSPNAVAQSPGQPEICDGIRNDCGTEMADVGAIAVPWYGDHDGDGFGSASSGITTSCAPVAGSSLLSTDCDDANAMRHPAAAEACNAIDDDCSGAADFRIAPNDTEDDDHDGLADIRCTPVGVDCDDHDPSSAPGEAERCDGRDNDCDGNVDEGAMSVVFYRDVDGDGYGAVASGSTVGCMATSGFVTRGGDCNDDDASRRPGATELCDAADQDCDATIDEAPASTMCAPAFTSASACIAGRCTVDACTAGHGDCNHLPLDGCEIDLGGNVDHCGACGHECADGVPCAGGVCQPSQIFPGGSFVSTQGRSLEYTISTPAPSTIRYTTDGSVPGSPTTITMMSPVTLGLADGQRVRWSVDHGGGMIEPPQELTHYTDAVTTPGPENTSGHPRDNWTLIVEHLSLNGLGPAITVAPGAVVNGTADATTWRQSGGGYCSGCATFAQITRLSAPGTVEVASCVGLVSTPYPGASASPSFSFTAPTTPGRYPIYSSIAFDFSCMPYGGTEIGYVIVAAP